MAEYHLKTPISEEDIRKLKAGDILYVSGLMVTARDEAHERALHYHKEGKKLPVELEGGVVYHCGPVMRKVDDKWEVVVAGPTTSARMEIFESDFIRAFKVRVIIGKGGMGEKTTAALKDVGAVYASFTGGAAVLAAKGIKEVKGVEWFDLGMPEALWIFEADDFGPLIVTIDSHGNNLHRKMDEEVQKNLPKVYEMLGINK